MNIQGKSHASSGLASGSTMRELTQAETRTLIAVCDHDWRLASNVAALCSMRLYERPVSQVSPPRPAPAARTPLPSRSAYFEKFDRALYEKAMQGQEPGQR